MTIGTELNVVGDRGGPRVVATSLALILIDLILLATISPTTLRRLIGLGVAWIATTLGLFLIVGIDSSSSIPIAFASLIVGGFLAAFVASIRIPPLEATVR